MEYRAPVTEGASVRINPQDLRLHDVDTSKGHWGIFVQSVVEAQNGENLFATIILEQNIDDEHIRSRKLEVLVAASAVANPSGRNGVLNQIRQWIETTEGDGSLTVVPG
jgi:hypothetical protein